jgi:hypothetical protein
LPAVAKTVAETLASAGANSSANTSSKLRVACAMARLAASGGIDSLGDGASLETARNVAASLDAVLQSLAVAATAELKRQAMPTNTRVSAAAIVGYLGLTTLLKSANARTLTSFQLSFHQIVEAAANEADRICKAADGADEADPSRDAAALHRVVSDLALTTNRSGTTIHRGPTGITVESTGMGVHSVRSATTWPLKWKRGDALLRYFEASVDAKRVTVKRIILGLADPLADVTTISAVMRPNSKYRVVAIDSSSLNDQAYVAPFSAIDVIGCGIDVTTSEVFFTLNGSVVRRRPLVQDESANALADGNLVVGSAVLQSIKARDLTELVPFLLYETTDRASVQLNLGQAPFAQDFRALSKLSSTSSVGASYAGDLALQALPNLAVAVEASVGEASTLAKGLVDALRNGLRALTAAGAKADGDDAGLVRLASVLSALAHVAFHKRLLNPAELFADLIKATTASTGMTKVVLLATVADIADRDSALANNHATELVELAAPVALAPKRATKPATSTFEPLWEQTLDESTALNGSFASLRKKHRIGHVLGSPLPRRGTTTFSVMVTTRNPQVGSAVGFGQFYVGVTTAPLSTVTGLGWKSAEPPVVWALHSDTKAQLGHANVASFGIDPFVFAPGTVLTVCVDRDRGTVSFSRGSRTYMDVFTGVPKDAEVRPFVQLLEEFTSAVIVPGQRERTLTVDKLLQRDATRVLRRLLTLKNGSQAVATLTCDDLEATADAKDPTTSLKARRQNRALTVLGALADPAAASLHWVGGSATCTVVRCVGDRALVRAAGGSDWGAGLVVPVSALYAASRHVALPPLRVPSRAATGDGMEPLPSQAYDDPFAGDSDADDEAAASGESVDVATAAGLQRCVDAAASIVARWCRREISFAELIKEEDTARRAIAMEAEAGMWSAGAAVREQRFFALAARNATMPSAILAPQPLPRASTFNAHQSSPGIVLPEHYNGHLMLTPDDEGTGPWAGIANEAIAPTGVTNIRVMVDCEWRGLLPTFVGVDFGAGGYVGLCTDAYHGTARRHAKRATAEADMWAVPFVDTPQYHLPHSREVARNFRLVHSKDVVRLHINRTRRTMEVFVGSSRGTGGEISLGVLYDNLPPNVPLFPFVELPSRKASAVFLPDSAVLRRPISNSVRYAHLLGDTKSHNRHMCDGCVNDLTENELEAPLWFRCNTCADIDLCLNCFNAHAHPGHTFTQLNPASFTASPLEPGTIAKNATVELPAAPIALIASSGFTFDDAASRPGRSCNPRPPRSRRGACIASTPRRRSPR